MTETATPIDLKCRVCGDILTNVTDTNQALAHVMDKHSNALIVTAALGSLYLNAHLFDGTTEAGQARWSRNRSQFHAEFLGDLDAAIAGGTPDRLQLVFGAIPPSMQDNSPYMVGTVKQRLGEPIAAPAPEHRPNVRHRAGQPRDIQRRDTTTPPRPGQPTIG